MCAWKKCDTVVYYINPDFKFHQTIAMFSFVGSIVKRVIPELDINGEKNNTYKQLDYLYDRQKIKEKIKSITDKGASIILYDSFKTDSLDEIQNAIETFQKDVECPIASFISTKANRYSKPFTGMCKFIELLYKGQNKKIKKSVSMVIGNKAGLISFKRRKLYNTCTDRAFAYNIGLNFTTPERFFLELSKFSLWEWDGNILDKENRSILINNMYKIPIPIIIDEINKLPESNKYTVIVTGTPSCGKTTFAKKIKRKWDVDYNKGIVEIVSDNISTIEEMENRGYVIHK